MCALRAQSAVELEPDMQHISLANHIAPQACQVEFELLEDMQQQNTSWIRHQVVCIVFKEIVQIAEKLCWTRVKPPNRFSQYFILNTVLSKANVKIFFQFDCKQTCKSA